jgi:hypothetical protein
MILILRYFKAFLIFYFDLTYFHLWNNHVYLNCFYQNIFISYSIFHDFFAIIEICIGFYNVCSKMVSL